MDEAYPEAAAILRNAGWAPHDTWGVYTHGTLVMGSPKLGEFHVKNTARCEDSPETPDDPVAAAEWLVARFPVAVEETVNEMAAAPSEAGNSEPAGAPSDPGLAGSESSSGADGAAPAPGLDVPNGDLAGDAGSVEPPGQDDATGTGEAGSVIDADFSEPTDPPPEDSPSGAFIFGDNLEQQRTAAIGLVVQAAMDRMPAAIDYTRMSELRNFVMGVSEGRWPDDPALRDELAALEATESQRRAVESARDAKVAFLVSATREEIAAFDPEANWP